MDNDFLDGVFKIIGLLITIVVIGVFAGTIVWLIWPFAIPAAFPGLVSSGVLAAKLSWWSAVCLSWIFNLLIRASQTNNSR